MAKQMRVYDGSQWVEIASGTNDLTNSSIGSFRNVLINGGFVIDQRNSGSSQTITAGAALAYTADRWYAYCTGANVTGQRIAGASPHQYYYRFTGATSNTAIGFGQRIEASNSYYLSGQNVTLSAFIASSSLTSITWTAYYANTTDSFGTVATPTRTQIASGTFSINSTLNRYIATFSVPAAATTGIEILFTTGALTATNTLTFTGLQLEVGSIASLVERRPLGTELSLCQRYYWRMNSDASYLFTQFGVGGSTSATSAGTFIKHPVTMRTIPTSLDVTATASNYGVSNGIGNIIALSAVPTLGGNNRSADHTTLTLTVAAGLTAGQVASFNANNTSVAYVGIGAEL